MSREIRIEYDDQVCEEDQQGPMGDRIRAMEGRMNGKRRWNKECEVRLLTVAGMLLSLVAYLFFLGIPSPWSFILAVPTAVTALVASFYGLWSWNAHLKARWSDSKTRQDST
jgi:protein-S-isoprenylcysteine O-methyltransferase Ste14